MQMTNWASRFISVENPLLRQKRRARAPAPLDQNLAGRRARPTSTNNNNNNKTSHINNHLAAPAGTSAAHASIATAVAGHDAAAEAAGGGVAQVDQAGEGVGGVDGTGSRLPVADFRSRAAYFSSSFRHGARGTQSEFV